MKNLFKEHTEDEIINLIKEGKVDVDLKDLLISSINSNKNKIVKFLLDLDVPYDYLDKLNYDAYLMAVSRGNMKALNLLKNKKIDLFKTYTIDNENVTALSFIRDIDTLKFFEENGATKEQISDSINKIACGTIMYHDLELLKYLHDKYNLDLTQVIYHTPSKDYTILEKAKEIQESMTNTLKRKREMTFFVYELLNGEKNCEHLIKKACNQLNEFENEVEDIKKYYDYVSQFYID